MTPKRIFLSPPHMSGKEIYFVKEAFDSNYIAPLGPQVDAFEKEFSEYTGIAHCVALCSGTAAMHLAVRYIIENSNLKTGENNFPPLVLASTLTFIGSVTPSLFEGCDITFIDCDQKSWNMDPELLEKTLAECRRNQRLPQIVVPTDLYGQCCDYDRIFRVCRQYGVPVVVDAAEAMGAFYENSKQETLSEKNRVHAGFGSKAAVFSFNGNKIMTTSGGGMLASEDKALIDKARFWSQQARESFAHYEHVEIGYNYRMSNIVAAIGRGQIQVLDERVKRRREIFNYYREALGDVPGIGFMPEPEWSRSNRWLTVILITPDKFGSDREDVRLALEADNIESRPVWKPMHLQPVFDISGERKTTSRKKRFAARMVGGDVSEDLFKRGLCLPSGTSMTKTDLDRVIEAVMKCRRI
jgi:dTDP-4-amino-4,6-dideoxygalactose transaminase